MKMAMTGNGMAHPSFHPPSRKRRQGRRGKAFLPSSMPHIYLSISVYICIYISIGSHHILTFLTICLLPFFLFKLSFFASHIFFSLSSHHRKYIYYNNILPLLQATATSFFSSHMLCVYCMLLTLSTLCNLLAFFLPYYACTAFCLSSW